MALEASEQPEQTGEHRGRAGAVAHPHAARAEGRHFQGALSEPSLLHMLAPLPVAVVYFVSSVCFVAESSFARVAADIALGQPT